MKNKVPILTGLIAVILLAAGIALTADFRLSSPERCAKKYAASLLKSEQKKADILIGKAAYSPEDPNTAAVDVTFYEDDTGTCESLRLQFVKTGNRWSVNADKEDSDEQD